MERNIYKIGKELFIISDEEIKKENWYLDSLVHPLLTNFPLKHSGIEYPYENGKTIIQSTTGTTSPISTSSKIILTTDPDLIADGVQAIDDEFLEWFIKNPSCEFIKTEKWLNDEGKVIYSRDIPKEESKQVGQITEKGIIDIIGNCANCGVEFHIHKDIQQPKQETLEEAAEINRVNTDYSDVAYNSFIEGAKWQAEKMYSEEDIINFAKWSNRKEDKSKADLLKIWFKQFRNRAKK